MRTSGGVEGWAAFEDDTCASTGAAQTENSKLVKLFREFRRLISPAKPKAQKMFTMVDHKGNLIQVADDSDQVADDQDTLSVNQGRDQSEAGTLMVTIVSASDLASHDWWGKTDPFVECQVQGKSSTYFVTPHKNNDHNPVWNMQQELQFAPSDSLKCEIHDLDYWGWTEKVGEVIVSGSQMTVNRVRRVAHSTACQEQ
jgi:hypothetical protein